MQNSDLDLPLFAEVKSRKTNFAWYDFGFDVFVARNGSWKRVGCVEVPCEGIFWRFQPEKGVEIAEDELEEIEERTEKLGSIRENGRMPNKWKNERQIQYNIKYFWPERAERWERARRRQA